MKVLFDEKLFGFIRVKIVEDNHKNQFLFVHDGKTKRKFESVHTELLPASEGTNRHLKNFLKKAVEITHKKTGESLSELQKDSSFKKARNFLLTNK